MSWHINPLTMLWHSTSKGNGYVASPKNLCERYSIFPKGKTRREGGRTGEAFDGFEKGSYR